MRCGYTRTSPTSISGRGANTPGLSDQVFISVLLRGRGSLGQPVYAAKHISLVGEDIYDLN